MLFLGAIFAAIIQSPTKYTLSVWSTRTALHFTYCYPEKTRQHLSSTGRTRGYSYKKKEASESLKISPIFTEQLIFSRIYPEVYIDSGRGFCVHLVI